jgi:two-component sensor histidine kinase
MSRARGAPPEQSSNDERSIAALAETNHRIANNLSLLAGTVSMRATQILQRRESLSHEEAAALLGEVSARIAAVGRLHRSLSIEPEAARIDLHAHLLELCETLLAALAAPGQVDLTVTSSRECLVGTEKVLPLCLIVTEVVTNSLKYSHPAGVPGKLVLGCRNGPDESLLIEVGDDGIGLPEGFEFADHGGIGSRTIRVLAKQLGAEVSLESRPIGSWFKLRLPSPG